MKKEASAKHILIKGPEGKAKLAILKKDLEAAVDVSAAFSELAAKVSEGRVIHFRDAQAWLDYMHVASDMTPTHAVFACAVHHSRLLADFLALVVAEQYRLFSPTLPKCLWTKFLEECRERDPSMSLWSESTRDRQRSSVFQTLAQAGYLDNTKTCALQAVHIAEPVLKYLRGNNETAVLRAILVGP